MDLTFLQRLMGQWSLKNHDQMYGGKSKNHWVLSPDLSCWLKLCVSMHEHVYLLQPPNSHSGTSITEL